MSEDIVERLRRAIVTEGAGDVTEIATALGEEAAAEIEALRERVREAEKAIRGADAYLTPDELSSFSECTRVLLARQILRAFLAAKAGGDA